VGLIALPLPVLPPDVTAEEVRELRARYGLTQQQVADLVYVSIKTVQLWERKAGGHAMPPGLWELLQIKLERLASSRR
jgi:DNA-binding transcriptional regulator YiaG